MHDPDLGLTVAFNGCIYNYPELRQQLLGLGYRFFSHSDTEVILKGYREWGERVVDHLKGMFAFAVTEMDSGRVVLARDRLGVKPLYWCDVEDADGGVEGCGGTMEVRRRRDLGVGCGAGLRPRWYGRWPGWRRGWCLRMEDCGGEAR